MSEIEIFRQQLERPIIAVTLHSPLDQFAPPQVLKIDVEGMEYAVLSGARNVVGSTLIFCEVTNDHEAIGKLLREADYAL